MKSANSKLACKELLLLFLPVVALGATGLALQYRGKQKTQPLLTLEKVAVTPIRLTGKRPLMQKSDTRVSAIIEYHPPSVMKEFFGTPQWFPFSSPAPYLQDAKGKKYQLFKTSAKPNSAQVGMTVGWLTPLKGHRYSISWEFPLRQVPIQSGKVTLKAVVGADGYVMPISIPVRNIKM